MQAFKDRHYLRREFAELMPRSVRDDPKAWTPPLDPAVLPPPDLTSPDARVVLELGCGVGNSAFPLMRANLDMFVHACDCSPTAIAALRANPEHDPRRCNAFVADLGRGDAPLRGDVDDASVDAVTGVFFFSALDAEGFARVALECARVLRPGGVVLFRDYDVDDVKNGGGRGGGGGVGGGGDAPGGKVNRAAGMREEGEGNERRSRPGATPSFEPGEKIGDDAYVRSDGTLAVFTDIAAVERAFGAVGLEGECWKVSHEIVNRKLGVKITRSFVQGRFTKPSETR